MLVEALHGALRDNVSFLDVLIWSMDFIIGQPNGKEEDPTCWEYKKNFIIFLLQKMIPKPFWK